MARRSAVPIETLSFFFQAEDGIRDIGVTGVQTCALPISASGAIHRYRVANGRWLQVTERRTPDGGIVGVRTDITERSEERRVGEGGDLGTRRLGQKNQKATLRPWKLRAQRERQRHGAQPW